MALRNPHWSDADLDESILSLCDEIPDARMSVCSRALEYCRRSVPHGTRESLLNAMRQELRYEIEVDRALRMNSRETPQSPLSAPR